MNDEGNEIGDVDEEAQTSSYKIKKPWDIIFSIRNKINNPVKAFGQMVVRLIIVVIISQCMKMSNHLVINLKLT